MAFWNRKNKDKVKKKHVKTIKIQASEGGKNNVLLESMLTGRAINISIPGTTSAFTDYEAQTDELYRKYNAQSDFGNQQARACIDLRTAFIAGEGMTVSAEKPQTAAWLEKFIKTNKLNSFNLTNAAKGAELSGQALFVLKKGTNKITRELEVRAKRIPYTPNQRFKPVYSDMFKEDVIDIKFKTKTGWESVGFSNFVYIRTGGDDANYYGPVSKVGVVLTDLENYDRALKDLRRNNHICARITPTFKTSSDSETAGLTKWLTDLKWKIGKAFIGKAILKYETPGTGAHENLISEMTSTIKTISAVTGIPVHWLGYVDLMSNRATAETLYELIKNATSAERTIWEASLYELIFKAQELYINSGGTDLVLDPHFQVRLPLISFANFLEMVRALNIAYGDKAISIDDYMNAIPGIDPLKTKRAIALEEEKEKDKLKSIGKSMGINNNFNMSDEDEGDQDG
jgi:hypothetical protein